jgi:hypothetical protein
MRILVKSGPDISVAGLARLAAHESRSRGRRLRTQDTCPGEQKKPVSHYRAMISKIPVLLVKKKSTKWQKSTV